MIDIEGHLLGSDPSAVRDILVEMGTQTNINKRESDLKDTGVARKIARAPITKGSSAHGFTIHGRPHGPISGQRYSSKFPYREFY